MGTIVKVGRFVWKVVDVSLSSSHFRWELSSNPKGCQEAGMAMLKVMYFSTILADENQHDSDSDDVSYVTIPDFEQVSKRASKVAGLGKDKH